MRTLLAFIRFYVISMRLHFGFITGIAAWIGISFYEYLNPAIEVSLGRKTFMLLATFLAYGVNQIINDYFGIEEDKINAPSRPMVTGELNKHAALFVSISLMLLLGIISFIVAPLSVVPLAIGVFLNILYEYAKAISILGNIIYGMSMAVCPVFGYLVAGPVQGDVVTWERIFALIFIVYITGRLTYFTYFKDYEGDKLAGKRTFIVKYGLDLSRKVGLVLAVLPLSIISVCALFNLIPFDKIVDVKSFIFCCIVEVFLQIWSAALYYKAPLGEATYYNLKNVIQACVAGQILLIAIYNGPLAIYLLCSSYILIDFIYGFHKNAKA